MSGRNFSLTPHLSGFIDEQVSSGRHQNASEVVREALRRYENDILINQAHVAALEKVVEAGVTDIERGDYVEISGDEGLQVLLEELHNQARARVSK
ncbi:type II toxin-antitoxin system ParD family antitoxin [Nitrospirillum sp. BR 11828]|uniref:type II toxin-antitoxin system ParD family antitoxin n=1 Tax=Nitrospirillum sp. BR 11828 TaxID=3104325 RepID=UPI002ACAAB20|nr:type II toxin-antitoxin system ParD family antitoxin [Nitrospirillum sp. BR 11828]MDZ5650269.1 type II toxin-antitoxin system ParD family antitoxin [Nitrospirillum sp. BR 11828]